MRPLRKKEARARLGGIGKTKFQQDYINTGRVRVVPISERIQGIPEEDIDTVIAEKIAAEAATHPDRLSQARDSASGRFVKASSRKSTKEIHP